MIKNKCLFFIAIILFMGNAAHSQNSSPEKSSKNIIDRSSSQPIEKVYLQMDKPYYAAGDTIWFKGYVVSGTDHQLSDISSVLNVELINERDSVKQRVKLFLKNGLCQGDIALPDSVKAGYYRIRAYTNWMRNAGEEYFFDRNLKIVNAVANNVFTKASYTFDGPKAVAVINYTNLDGVPYADTKVDHKVQWGAKAAEAGKGITDNKGNLRLEFANIATGPGSIVSNIKLTDTTTATSIVVINSQVAKNDIQFFPEGGSLINGLEGKVAFKAVSSTGLGVPVSGIVVDGTNVPVASFNCGQLGMGVFTLTPESGKVYTAKVTNANGIETALQIPKAVDNGYALSICEAGADHLRVIVMAGTGANTAGALSLVARAGGMVYYAGKSKPDTGSFITTIAKNKFPTGVVQFTLSSANGEPLNERLMFIQNNDQLNLNINGGGPTPQQKVKLQLAAKTADGKPTTGSFSVAVIDEARVPADETAESSILSNLLLTSDLRGYVEKPTYYFSSVNEKTQADLDALILTQGYRKFEWKKTGEDFYRPDTGLTISGRVTNGSKPVAKEKVTLYTTDGGFVSRDTLTDNAGRFAFGNMVFGDSTRFVVQTSEKNRFKYKLTIDAGYTKATPNKNLPGLLQNNDNDLLPFLQASRKLYTEELKYDHNSRSKMLKTVTIKERGKLPELKYSDNLNGPGRADQVFTAADIKSFNCGFLSECLQGRLAGIVVTGAGPTLFRLVAMFGSHAPPMLILLDNRAIDKAEFDALNPNTLESIEVLRSMGSTAIYGGKGNGGILVVTSKRGITDDDMTYNEKLPGYTKLGATGFTKIREFYSPQYDNPKTNIPTANLRSTIFWSPNVLTSKDGMASVEYFNAGSKGNYKVTVEGIDEYGKLGYQVYHYKVE